MKRREICERLGRRQGDEAVQGHKCQSDDEIEQDCADNAVIRDPPRREHGARHHDAECETGDQPRDRIEVEIGAR